MNLGVMRFWLMLNSQMATYGQAFALEKIGDRVMADLIQMLRQVRASVVGDGADQKFNVLKFGNHSRILPCGTIKRKS